MTPQEFVSCIRHEVLEQNLAIYCQSLKSTSAATSVSGKGWPQMTAFYESLDEDQRRQFLNVIRQVMVDTLSNVFGILDGSTILERHRDYFRLSYGDDSRELNGELQDLFLSSEDQRADKPIA